MSPGLGHHADPAWEHLDRAGLIKPVLALHVVGGARRVSLANVDRARRLRRGASRDQARADRLSLDKGHDVIGHDANLAPGTPGLQQLPPDGGGQ